MPSTSTTKIYYVDPSATPLSTQNYSVTLNTSLTRPTTRCYFQHPPKPFRLKHPASLNTTSLAAPRTNRLKAANKKLSLLCYQRIVSQSISVAIKYIVLGKLINSLKTAIEQSECILLWPEFEFGLTGSSFCINCHYTMYHSDLRKWRFLNNFWQHVTHTTIKNKIQKTA